MPMDSDDNEYHCQGFHIVNEESSKISPVLHSYALPKFDFDEGNLRFDSLVENEVFLGIPSQEDNQWIEDFSRGSSGVDFSSSAADSCSIPRHNNVWSEATSSESVEMLLKSVGQEEMVLGESVIEDSDPRNEWPSSSQMDSILTRDSNKEDVKDSSSGTPAEIHRGFSPLNQIDVKSENVATSQGIDQPFDGYTSVATEQNLLVDVKGDDKNLRKDYNLSDESLILEIQEDPPVSVVENIASTCVSPDTVTHSETLSVQDKALDISSESSGGFPVEINMVGGQDASEINSILDDGQVMNSPAEFHTSMLHSTIYVASEVKVLSENAVKTTGVNVEKSLMLPPEGSSDLPSDECCNIVEFSAELAKAGNVGHAALTEGTDMEPQSESKDLSADKFCAAIKDGDDCGKARSSVGAEIGDVCGKVQSLVVSSNGQNSICSELEKESLVPKLMSECARDGDDAVVSSGECLKSVDHVEPAKTVSSLKIIRGLSAEQDPYDGKPFNGLQEGNDENLVSDSVKTNTEIILPDDDGNNFGVQSSSNINEENVGSTGGSDSSPRAEVGLGAKVVRGDTESQDEGYVPSVQVGADAVVEDVHQNEDQMSHSILVASLHSNDKEDKEVTALVEGGMEAQDEEAKHGLGTIATKVAPTVSTAEAVANNVNQSFIIIESCAGATNVEQVITEAGQHSACKEDKAVTAVMEGSMGSLDKEIQQNPGAIATKVVPAISTAEAEANNVNQSLNMVECYVGATDVEQVITEAGQEPCGAELVSLHSVSDVRVRDGAESGEQKKLKDEAVVEGHLTPSREVAGSSCTNCVEVMELCVDSTPIDASELPNEGKEEACMTEGKHKDALLSNVADAVVENLSSVLSWEEMKDTSEKKSSEGEKGTLEEERSFTFHAGPVPTLPGRETSVSWPPTNSIQAAKTFMTVEGAHSTSVHSQTDSQVAQEAFHGSPQMHDKRALSVGSKGASERKARRGSGKSGKENSKKENFSKQVGPKIQRQVGDNLRVILSASGAGKITQTEAGSSAPKPSGVLANSANLPDLNTTMSTTVLLRQSFTDLQQVQLRAQIFVYGSLIQGAAPDEACMVSAFGISDGGRSIWEPAWRACLERLKKSHLSSSETPVQSRPGAKSSDETTKTGLNQSKPRASSKVKPSTVVNPMIPLSSPLWNVSTPLCDALPTNTVARGPVMDYQTLSPLNAYQTPPGRNFSGHTTWLSQAPFSVPWVASPQASSFDVNAHVAASQTIEPVKLTAVKVSAAPKSSATKHASPISVSQNGHSIVVSGLSAMHETQKVAASCAPNSVDPKYQRRKKASVSEDIGQIALPVAISQPESVSASVTAGQSADRSPALRDLGPASLLPGGQAEKVSVFAEISQFATPVAIPTPSVPGLKSSSEEAVTVASPFSSVDPLNNRHQIAEKRTLSLDDVAKVEETKLQAEQAGAHAAVAVSHCQNVWSQLDKQKSSSLLSDGEAKLASAAVCIAAAASVAKAASAAAKVASSVALQAKLMADEALISNGSIDSVQSTSQPLSGFVGAAGSATLASILEVGEGNGGSSLIIFAAREAAKRRVEAASAASKHAENLDAIVKAAELAAEAVAQAGKIVAMGDPLPLSKLVESGPAGYWKDSGIPFGKGSKLNVVTQNNGLNSVEEHRELTEERSQRTLDNTLQITSKDVSLYAVEKSMDLAEDQAKGKFSISSVICAEGELGGQKSPIAPDVTKTVGVIPESESGVKLTTDENMADVINDNRLSVNSPVEVFKDNGDCTGAWFSANVLSLKGGKALVSYKDLETDEGKRMEWVPLEAGGCKPPVIRLAHPMTSLMFDGTRKRRREIVKDYGWSLGDRVDAWLGNCWREGVVVEKIKKDETTLNVHLPGVSAQGKTVAVKAWHLRPTLIWTNGEWIEPLISRNDKSPQGDTPQEKRLKLSSPSVDGKGKIKITTNMDPPESRKFEESRMLPLSAKERSFHIGSTKNDKPETLRTTRSSLQKERSKVVFGVPKPGKKRKYMEVSKHYVSSGNTKISATIDKEKSAKHSVPQVVGVHGWKNSSKIDPKEKQAAELKTRSFRSTKAPNLFTRTLPQKDKSVSSSVAGLKEEFSTENIGTDSTSNDNSGHQYLADFVSTNIEEESEDPVSFSSQAPVPCAPKKTAASNAKSDRLKKGKFLSTVGMPNKVVEQEKSVPDVFEPRRSNRRIQPTSRLLEGLQSALVMSKAPSVSQDKSQKSQNKGETKGSTPPPRICV